MQRPDCIAGELLERDRLAHVNDLQTRQIGELQTELERLRDWSSGNANGVALSNLLQIVSDGAASVRQKLKAAAAILGFKVEDPGIIEFTKRFLESLCANPDIATDYRVESAALLRQHESPRIKPDSAPPTYREEPADPAEPPPIPLRELLVERRAYCDQRWREIEAEMPELQPYRSNRPRNGDDS